MPQKSANDDFWFKLFLATKKFMRKDYLIGTHLLLDCMKIILVQKMLERDQIHHTNIHRFGYLEDIDTILALDKFILSDTNQIMDYLVSIANQYDSIMVQKDTAYQPKKSFLLTYLGI